VIQVLIVAPYASVRAGLRVLLTASQDIVIAGEARDVEALEYLLKSQTPDAVLYDASTGALEPVLALLTDSEVPIVALCEDVHDVGLLVRSRTRAWAALQRSAGADEIAGGIHAAVSGIVGIDPAYAGLLAFEEPFRELSDSAFDDTQPVLTPREREVLQLMTHGLPNKNIAARLHISLSTAKFHVASILTKLDASSRTEAVTIGARRGLVSL
jgi:DNA-binding NarL/FixJ family response regulator